MQSQSLVRSYEQNIWQLRRQNEVLREENNGLKQQLRKNKQHLDRQQIIRNKDPLVNIFEGITDLPKFKSLNGFSRIEQLQRKITVLSNKLDESQHVKNLMSNVLKERVNKIKDLQTENIRISQQKIQLNGQLQLAYYSSSLQKNRCQELENQLKKHQTNQVKNHEDYLQLKNEVNESEIKHRQQIRNLSREIQTVAIKWLNKFNSINHPQERGIAQGGEGGMGEDRIESFNQNSQFKFKQLLQKFKMQQQIMEEMGSQLDIRNQQIAKIISLQGFHSNKSEKDYFNSHTINSFLFLSRQKQHNFKSLLQKYRELSESFKTCYQQKLILQQEYIKVTKDISQLEELKKENYKLRNQLQECKIRQDKTQSQLRTTAQDLINVMQQNTALHTVFYDKYGKDLYSDKIDYYKKEYQMRAQQRQQKSKWASVQELIKMNKKLQDTIFKRK